MPLREWESCARRRQHLKEGERERNKKKSYRRALDSKWFQSNRLTKTDGERWREVGNLDLGDREINLLS